MPHPIILTQRVGIPLLQNRLRVFGEGWMCYFSQCCAGQGRLSALYCVHDGVLGHIVLPIILLRLIGEPTTKWAARLLLILEPDSSPAALHSAREAGIPLLAFICALPCPSTALVVTRCH